MLYFSKGFRWRFSTDTLFQICCVSRITLSSYGWDLRNYIYDWQWTAVRLRSLPGFITWTAGTQCVLLTILRDEQQCWRWDWWCLLFPYPFWYLWWQTSNSCKDVNVLYAFGLVFLWLEISLKWTWNLAEPFYCPEHFFILLSFLVNCLCKIVIMVFASNFE